MIPAQVCDDLAASMFWSPFSTTMRALSAAPDTLGLDIATVQFMMDNAKDPLRVLGLDVDADGVIVRVKPAAVTDAPER